MCVMEYIYFARPDSVVEGCSVHSFRKLTGRLLYEECPTDADIVIYVPDSSMSAAIGYAEASRLPMEMGLIKNMYVARTFIQPAQSMRDIGVKMKLTPVRSIVKDRRVVVIDDSIVRGTTSRQIVSMLRDAGAREIHLRIASPKYAWPCFYGIDTGTREQLIGSAMTTEEICSFIGADSLYYLSEEALFKASGRSGLCTACFSGRYPTDLYGHDTVVSI
jgi:amidophosphoribosyltransferase